MNIKKRQYIHSAEIIIVLLHTLHCKLACLRDDNTLVTLLPTHEVISVVCNGEDVWRLFSNSFSGVLHDLFLIIDRQQLVRIDSHKDGPCVCLKEQSE